jgi:hypothetical protein
MKPMDIVLAIVWVCFLTFALWAGVRTGYMTPLGPVPPFEVALKIALFAWSILFYLLCGDFFFIPSGFPDIRFPASAPTRQVMALKIG